jgi:hypothetical protein
VAAHVSHLPPVSTLFSSFLGYNPVRSMLAPSGVLHRLPRADVQALTSKEFFPNLVSAPFHHGLVVVFTAAIAMSVTGAVVSMLRGRQFYYTEPGTAAAPTPDGTPAGPVSVPAQGAPAAGGDLARGQVVDGA